MTFFPGVTCEMYRTCRDAGFCVGHCMFPVEVNFIVGPCPCCDGAGEVCVGMVNVYEPGCGVSHPEPVIEPCDLCGASGGYLFEAVPIGINDLENICGDDVSSTANEGNVSC